MAASASESEPWTVKRLLGWTQEHFARQGLESPRLCSEILLAHAMGCQRLMLFTQHELVPGKDVLDAFRANVQQAAEGRPIAHLTGSKEFFSLSFEVSADVLIPRPETEILVERVIHLVRHGGQPAPTIIDLGTGSGCIAISLAANLPDAKVIATDISEQAITVARRNAERHGVSDRIDFLVGDLLAPWEHSSGSRPADIIVSNPPYIAETQVDTLSRTVRAFEPHAALFGGRDGLAVIRRILAEAPRWMVPGGHLLLEIAFDQAERVRDLPDAAHWTDLVTYRDGGGHERVVHLRRRADDQSQVA